MDEIAPGGDRRALRPVPHVLLFLLTGLTTWAAGGPGYSAALLAILLVHETGHYLLARRHGVQASLPYFVPFLPVGIGTLGAVIRLRSPMPTSRALLEIGSAGPIAGFVIAVPLLLWGLAHSELVSFQIPSPDARLASGIDVVAQLLAGGDGLSRQLVLGDSIVTWIAGKAVVGEIPEGQGLLLHPVAWAAWLGLFITALNLVPQGQLDGGHVLYALLGPRAARVASRLVSWSLMLLGIFVSFNWLAWWAVTRVAIGFRHPPPLVEEPLGRGRRALAVGSLLLLAATFVPVPFSF